MKLTRIGQNVIENGGVSAITPENVGTVVSTVFGPRVNPLDQRMAAKAYSTDATIRAIEQNMLARQTLAYNAGEIAEMSTRALQSAGTGGNYRKQMAVLTQAILSNSRYLLENTQTVLSEQEREISRDLEVRVEDGSLPWLRDKSAGETQQAVNEEEELPWLEDQESSSLTTPGTTIDK